MAYILTTSTVIYIKKLDNGSAQVQNYIQGVSRLVGITAGGDFLGLCDQKNLGNHLLQ